MSKACDALATTLPVEVKLSMWPYAEWPLPANFAEAAAICAASAKPSNPLAIAELASQYEELCGAAPAAAYIDGVWVESESQTCTLTELEGADVIVMAPLAQAGEPQDPLAYFNPPEPPKSTARKLPGVDVVAGEWPRVQIGLRQDDG